MPRYVFQHPMRRRHALPVKSAHEYDEKCVEGGKGERLEEAYSSPAEYQAVPRNLGHGMICDEHHVIFNRSELDFCLLVKFLKLYQVHLETSTIFKDIFIWNYVYLLFIGNDSDNDNENFVFNKFMLVIHIEN